jgi:hypothetical protein
LCVITSGNGLLVYSKEADLQRGHLYFQQF